ncbi:MAG: AhpC/TSA family protein [Acidobacteriia bacterium]|nr:AhpC/TSA family protein [Terriglobia bacterium]
MATNRIQPGVVLQPRELHNIDTERVRIPDREGLVHLQFRRFAGCPVCNLHLRSFVERYSEITAASIREVIVFHSRQEELKLHAKDLPFEVIADPDKHLYAEFGVDAAYAAIFDPRAWLPIVRGIGRSLLAIARGKESFPAVNPAGGRFGLPADFLIAPDGTVLACKYGVHAYDQWSVDEMLALARESAAIRRQVHRSSDMGSGPVTDRPVRIVRDLAPLEPGEL